MLSGHSDKVNVIKFFRPAYGTAEVIISGSVDKTIRIWCSREGSPRSFECAAVLEGHSGSVNCLATTSGSNIIASGGADGLVKVWQLEGAGTGFYATLLQTLQINTPFLPLALALSCLDENGDLLLAIGGTKSTVHVYANKKKNGKTEFIPQCILTGHEDWIRSLTLTRESCSDDSDLLLASASQDKYIRLWRIHQGNEVAVSGRSTDNDLGSSGKSLSNKTHRIEASGLSYTITFEALLLGHEDWIYTVNWYREEDKLQLLSASADSSLAFWESDPASGVWVCTTRMGEISGQKGSTTATGSTGGYWIGLWSPNGDFVASLGRTGSWRLWKHDRSGDRWIQDVGISGHVKDITDVAWAKDGSFLLSTGSDQTTRLHAEWKCGTKRTWHEFARPQIHGYDMNCVDTLLDDQFVSGADEKLLRVFDEPCATADLLGKLCGIDRHSTMEMPKSASIPVLGLSNKAVEATDDDEPPLNGNTHDHDAPDPTSNTSASGLDLDHPPFEDHLSRHTLWPEKEKLYGHGFEISTLAASHDGSVVATACKASSADHAVIRLYETQGWREIKPPLTVHSLTVTCLQFSEDDQFLLSVGRDRQWALFERKIRLPEMYALKCANPKAHSRMVLAGAWAPLMAGRSFATASRDKTIKIWKAKQENFVCDTTIPASSPVTAVDYFPSLTNGKNLLAIGTESGDITLYYLDSSTSGIITSHPVEKRYVCQA